MTGPGRLTPADAKRGYCMAITVFMTGIAFGSIITMLLLKGCRT